MPETKDGIEQYLYSVQQAISAMSEWKVHSDVTLDFFSFSKFIMYKDLDPTAWPEGRTPADHHLIRAILDPEPESSETAHFSEEEIDEKLRFWDLYHVMDADPSQIAAIEDVKSGCNLVVEGPPGTGKSQTITNIIAELLALGKSVLFVSEKMAALEVVKERLDKVGLGHFCLELHSRKTKKKEFLNELQRAASLGPSNLSWSETKYHDLERIKDDLNAYVKALREPIGKLEITPFELFSTVEKARRHFEKAHREMPRVRFPEAQRVGKAQLRDAREHLTHLSEVLVLVSPLREHPFFGCEPGRILPSDEHEIKELLIASIEKLQNLMNMLDLLSEKASICFPQRINDLQGAVQAARVIGQSKPVDRNVLLNEEWNKPSEQSKEIIAKVEAFQKLIVEARKKFGQEAFKKDVPRILKEFRERSKKPLRLLSATYRETKRTIRDMYKNGPPRKREQKIADLEMLKECLKLRSDIKRLSATGRALFGSHWKGEESNTELLRGFSQWIVQFRQQLIGKALTDEAVEAVSSGVSSTEINACVKQAVASWKGFFEIYKSLVKFIRPRYSDIYGCGFKEVDFQSLIKSLGKWRDNLSSLQRWSHYVEGRKACLATVANPLIGKIEQEGLHPEDVLPTFEGNFADELIRIAYQEIQPLSSFVGDLHEKKISRFVDLDRELIEMNRKRLLAKLFQDRPRLTGGASSGSEAGILLGEFGKKRRHLPIRKLMASAGQLIQHIKPCFMMSPLSIAQFLDPRTSRFDVIIFDEASQVRPEDALGALLRGNQVAVLGDTKQLPPTSFFENIVEAKEEEDEEVYASAGAMESILHQCKRCFSTKALTWHYRSRHESLIAVSNQEFYDNQLRIYPSPHEKTEALGLQFVHLPETVYDRGRSSTNRKEAKAVAQAAVEHYQRYPDKSLGVGAFNIRQQQAILEEIELQLHMNPKVETYFTSDRPEHFFVKNLETIQGDERDTIFISVGFGFDQARKLSLNFGPLNQDGGERRLNVLITRAREKCVVFSNFRAADLAFEDQAPFALRALKTFLTFAENRELIQLARSGGDSDSPFEEAVYDCLKDRGYEVRRQVGCAGFRVDLAVVDPEFPGRYILGIECDGAKYHSSPVARDRDRLRQQILEGLGWRIHRIWSTDWYRNRRDCEERLLRTVELAQRESPRKEQLKKQNPNKTATPNEPESARVINFPKSPITSPNDFKDAMPEYQVCTSLGIPTSGELHEQPAGQLAVAVENVVKVEGPIHIEELIRRIRTLWGLKRSGNRIASALQRGIEVAKKKGAVQQRGDFLWPSVVRIVRVRRRSDDPPPRIEYICEEEIAEAIRAVLRAQFATIPDDLVQESSRLLGIQATREHTAERIRKVIGVLMNKGELEGLPNGMIQLWEAK
jgi:superfamily I DNA and/or RNA helicase